MNAFENIITQYLEAEGYWVRQSVKIKISKDDKKAMDLPTMPNPEIDLVALNMKENELLLIEVKSYLDSYGVYYGAVSGNVSKGYEKSDAQRYRLLNDSKFRDIVTKRIREAFLQEGLINEKTKINYALAAGNIHSPKDEADIRTHFSMKGWKLFSPQQIREKVKELAEKGWEDNLVTITAKLILRDEK